MERGSAKIILPVDGCLSSKLLKVEFDELQVAFAGGVVKVTGLALEIFIIFLLVSAAPPEDTSTTTNSDRRFRGLGPDRHPLGDLLHYLFPAIPNELTNPVEASIKTTLPAVFGNVRIQHFLDAVDLRQQLLLVPVALEDAKQHLAVVFTPTGQLVEFIGNKAPGLHRERHPAVPVDMAVAHKKRIRSPGHKVELRGRRVQVEIKVVPVAGVAIPEAK